jgi:hypothetical protein
MPSHILTYLKATFGVIGGAYLALVIFTMYLASTQMALASSIGDTEAAIGRLEASYYTKVSAIDATDPSTLGFVMPAQKLYARAESGPVLTKAGL